MDSFRRAKDNVRRAVEALDVDHEFVTVEGMNEIFRDSLERYSNVCNGCYKAIYTVALDRASRLGIPAIVTGLSRGQFFETRLVPGMFEADRFDPAAIDEAVDAARRVYHSTPDAVSEQLDVQFLADGSVLDAIEFIDFYRYVDVELAEMYAALEESGTWSRPDDTGRSTNCLINAAGIYVHKIEQAHHNYAVPYSWDVRLGHKTREEAMEELDDPMDATELASITAMLAEVGYEPRPPEILTLWVEADADLDLDVVRCSVACCFARPRSAPGHRSGGGDPAHRQRQGRRCRVANALGATRCLGCHRGRAPASEAERLVAKAWEQVLGLTSCRSTTTSLPSVEPHFMRSRWWSDSAPPPTSRFPSRWPSVTALWPNSQQRSTNSRPSLRRRRNGALGNGNTRTRRRSTCAALGR